MALLYMDSFDHYVTADILEKWSTAPAGLGTGLFQAHIAAGAGRRGSDALRINAHYTDNVQGVTKTVTPSGSTVVIGLAIRVSIAPYAASNCVVQILENMTAHASLLILSNGSVRVTRGRNDGAILGTSASDVVPFGVYSYFELKLTLDPTTNGAVDVRLNGSPIISVSGLNTSGTGSTTWTGIALGTPGNAYIGSNNPATMDYDDLYLLDGSGSAPWNTFLGDCRVDPRYPTAEGTCAWAPKDGSDNAAMVNEHTPNDDGSYNATSTVGATDTFVMEDSPVAGATIHGVQVCLSHKKADAGPCTLAPVVAGVPGAGFNPSTSYVYRTRPYSTNPATGVAWTEAGFNAAQFGYTRTL